MGVNVREKPKGSGVFWVFINHQGRRKAKKVGKDKKLAMEAAKKIRAKLVLGDLDLENPQAEVATFGEYSKNWLAFIKVNRRESTHERYDQVLRDHILPVFKKKTLNAITRGEIRDFLVSKASDFDISVFRDVLSGILGFAVDDEIIKANPVTGLTKKLGLKKDKKDVEPLNEVDLNLFLNTCEKTEPEHYPFFLMGARTGMRLGEILAVKWEDLDFSHRVIVEDGTAEERPFIWVRQSYRRGRFTAPKNGKSRKVDMSNQLKATLKEHLTKEKKEAFRLTKEEKKALREKGMDEMPELVFHRDGKVIEQKYMQRIFKRMLRKAGLRQVKLHILRHTFASLLLSKGESPVYVKEQLGHSSIQITVDLYGKYIQTKKEPGVNKLDNATICNPAATSQNEKGVTY